MENLWLPTNIKQIGNIDDNIRVYIEDTVYSYLMKLSESKEQECIAALIGRCMIIDGKTVLFINGAIQGLYSEMEKGILKFSRLSMDYIEEERDKYFKGLEVVGWLLSQPNYGNFLSTGYINYHKQNFTKPYQVLFVTDPVEKIHTFFNWNHSRTDVIESEGFFIYYDRNNDMKYYIEKNKIQKYNNTEEVQLKLLDEEDYEYENLEDLDCHDLFDEIMVENKNIMKSKLTETETQRVIQTINKLSNEKTPQPVKERKKVKESKAVTPQMQQQRMLNMLVTVSSILFFISIALGAGIIQSDNKISELEQEVALVTGAYNELTSDFLGETTPVFNTIGTASSTATQNVASSNTPEVSINDILDGEKTASVEVQSTEVEEKTEVATSQNISYETYKIGVGDTLTSISTKFYGTREKATDIMELNGIKDPNKIYYGMVIKLP